MRGRLGGKLARTARWIVPRLSEQTKMCARMYVHHFPTHRPHNLCSTVLGAVPVDFASSGEPLAATSASIPTYSDLRLQHVSYNHCLPALTANYSHLTGTPRNCQAECGQHPHSKLTVMTQQAFFVVQHKQPPLFNIICTYLYRNRSVYQNTKPWWCPEFQWRLTGTHDAELCELCVGPK